MKTISDLQVGKAGEYLVCADLIMNGHVAFLSEQGLPYDVVLSANDRLYKVQVKTTMKAKNIPQRKTAIPAYIFQIGRHGKNNRWEKYSSNEVDIFSMVALDTKKIAYMKNRNVPSTINLRAAEQRGNYRDEQSVQIKEKVMFLKSEGHSAAKISEILKMTLSNVYKYSANVSIIQKGTNSGIYFDELTLAKCLCDLE